MRASLVGQDEAAAPGVPWAGEAEPRYVMLETVREFGLEMLGAGGEERGVRLAHADHVLLLAERAHDDALRGTYRSALSAELGNLRGALGWLEAAGESERSLRLVGALWPFWYVRGPFAEGWEWAERALAHGIAAAGRSEGRDLAALQKLASATRSSLPGGADPRGRALAACGLLAVLQGETARAAACFEESLALARGGRFTYGMSAAFLGLCWVAMRRGEFERAGELAEEGLALVQTTDDATVATVHAGLVLSNLGSVAYARGQLELAGARFEEALGRQRAAGHRWGEAFSLTGLAYVARARGDDRRAAALFREGLALFREHEDWRMVALALAGVAGVAIAGGAAGAGAHLLGAAAALRELGGIAAEPAYRAAHERDEAAARTALGEGGFAAAWDIGQGMSLEAALAAAAAFDVAADAAAAAPDRHGLTPRELEVLRLLVEGRSDRQIAAALSISHRTVMRHITHLLAKLDVESRTAAATQAVRRGLV